MQQDQGGPTRDAQIQGEEGSTPGNGAGTGAAPDSRRPEPAVRSELTPRTDSPATSQPQLPLAQPRPAERPAAAEAGPAIQPVAEGVPRPAAPAPVAPPAVVRELPPASPPPASPQSPAPQPPAVPREGGQPTGSGEAG